MLLTLDYYQLAKILLSRAVHQESSCPAHAHRARASCLPDSNPYDRDGLAHSRVLFTAGCALRASVLGVASFIIHQGYMNNINRSHTHTPTENNTPDTDTHTHDTNNTPNPQTKTSHKHLTTLEGGAMTVRATSHARAGGRVTLKRTDKSDELH